MGKNDWPSWVDPEARGRLAAIGIHPVDPRLRAAARFLATRRLADLAGEAVDALSMLAEIEREDTTPEIMAALVGQEDGDEILHVDAIDPGAAGEHGVLAAIPALRELLDGLVGLDVSREELVRAAADACGGTACIQDGALFVITPGDACLERVATVMRATEGDVHSAPENAENHVEIADDEV